MKSYVFHIILITFSFILYSCKGNYGSNNQLQDNIVPIAEAGANQTVYVGLLAILDGSGSVGGDGDVISYNWAIFSIPPGSTLTDLADANTVHPSFTPDITGDYTFQLTVHDGVANSNTDLVTITAQECITDRNYIINTPIAYSCGIGLHLSNVTGFQFSLNGSVISPVDEPSYIEMTGVSTSCPNGVIDHQVTHEALPGICNIKYMLQGEFTGPNTWSGIYDLIFEDQIVGGCKECIGQAYAIDAYAQD